MKKLISKKTNNAFGKKIFLLGRDAEGINYWLEEAKWDCGWYWGFGYVETYTNNKNPNLSKDIESHSHIDSSFMGQIRDKYVHNIFDAPTLVETTFTEKEGWLLSELFKTYYNLRKSAEVFDRGSSHVTENPLSDDIKDDKIVHKINTYLLPKIFDKIYEILTPKN